LFDSYWVMSTDTGVTKQELQTCYLTVVQGNLRAEQNPPFSGEQLYLIAQWLERSPSKHGRLVVTGGSLTRRSKRSLRCLLIEVSWQINEYLNLMGKRSGFGVRRVNNYH